MNIFTLPLLILLYGAWNQDSGPREIIPPTMEVRDRSFAIVADAATWKNCRAGIIAYRDMLSGEGLPAYILAADWQCPEEIREELLALYRGKHLEGAVFIGDIPIPMIRKAQHLTSTFKMDEEKFPMRDSSVPSDRFYDDFDLEFDFIRRDGREKLLFYYDLSASSPQEIRCDIYSGRIKPLKGKGHDPYLQISRYLEKAVAAHRGQHPLERTVSYTGEGTYSNSLTSWQSEQHILREHFPGVFDRKHNARFIRYDMWDYPREEVVRCLQDEKTDLMIFHGHGTTDCQYLSSTPAARDLEGQIRQVRAAVRKKLRQARAAGQDCGKEMQEWSDRFGVDTGWWTGYDGDADVRDSQDASRTTLVLEEISAIAPNARLVIFEACYNGDFREDDYMAGRYIFSDGKCVAAKGYSVNILQDKSPDDLCGLLGQGVRIGVWAQYTHLLESHILGDPTYRFTPPEGGRDMEALSGRKQPASCWLELLQDPHPDLQCLAFIQLQAMDFPGLSDTLRKRYEVSPYSIVRYQCMRLLEEYNDANFLSVLRKAWQDPYEFIRRTAVDRMGETGRMEFLPCLVSAYVGDYHSARVIFNVQRALELYRWPDVKACAGKVLDTACILDKAAVMQALAKGLERERQYRLAVRLSDTTLSDKTRLFEINYLKNANYHPGTGHYLAALADREHTAPRIRKALVESLAWFRLSPHREAILQAFLRIMEDSSEQPVLREAATRAYNRSVKQKKNE